jgi:putative Holliday junction resolvase
MALDYGSARTGVAVSDPTGTVARPLCTVERASPESIRALVEAEAADRVVVGLPLTLRGEHGVQATETTAFVDALRGVLAVRVETYDERFTTALAAREGGSSDEDARAAAHLLDGYLRSRVP